ncbi:unnamed protein product [Nesidiocoris tenuis]|uniref:Uncharacterized protein n=1 Tax=Nesidiocoris tenuis TaxID=355587 RepID=A0A6H5GWG8_9HEMI|nr:unnamed protein product [Nesidiocoris tenuis]
MKSKSVSSKKWDKAFASTIEFAAPTPKERQLDPTTLTGTIYSVRMSQSSWLNRGLLAATFIGDVRTGSPGLVQDYLLRTPNRIKIYDWMFCSNPFVTCSGPVWNCLPEHQSI